MNLLFNFKISLLSLSLILGLFSSVIAQRDPSFGTITKVSIPANAKVVVAKHLKAISTANYEGFKATYGHPNDSDDAMRYRFNTLTPGNYIVTQDLQDYKANSPQGFNTGIVMEKGFLIIVVSSKSSLKQAERLPHDLLNLSPTLGAGLRKQGVNTDKSMAFLLNTQTMRVMDAGSWNRLLIN